MKRSFLSVFLMLVVPLLLCAQNANDILMTIGGKTISKAEFVRMYEKNNSNTNGSKTSVDDYLQLYINFKLKAIEAENLKLDTFSSFKNELFTYRKQLVRPYFIDKELLSKLVREAYDRMQYEIRVSHILVGLDDNALESDSMLAFNKAMKIQKRILSGQSFEKVAKETSDDPSAMKNGGDLWYQLPFVTPYEFESYMYSAIVNEVSMPVRTSFGYHIIKVTDKRKSQGQVKVAHIMVALHQNSDSAQNVAAKLKIDDVYNRLKSGQDFRKLVEEFSDDKGTSKNGGELAWFGTGRMVKEFELAAFGLQKNGDISVPIKTQYGWHVIKRLDRKDLPSFDLMKKDLTEAVKNDSRIEICQNSILNKLRIEYNYQEVSSQEEFNNVIDTTIFDAMWTMDKAIGLTNDLFTFAGKKITQQDFAAYISRWQHPMKKISIPRLTRTLYQAYVNETIAEYEETQLENKYPEFKLIMQEYRDGLLLFDLSDKLIWTKASEDTVGLYNYYLKNQNNYLSTELMDLDVFSYLNPNTYKLALKYLEKRDKKKFSAQEIVTNTANEGGNDIKLVNNGVFTNGQTVISDIIFKMKKNNELNEQDKFVHLSDKKVIVYINQVLKPAPKPFSDIKGQVAIDYQNFIENDLVLKLKEKYKISINTTVLDKIKSDYTK